MEKKEKTLKYLTTTDDQEDISFTALSAHARRNTLSVVLNFLKNLLLHKAITCCTGRQLNMPKHTPITFCNLVSNTFLNQLLMT